MIQNQKNTKAVICKYQNDPLVYCQELIMYEKQLKYQEQNPNEYHNMFVMKIIIYLPENTSCKGVQSSLNCHVAETHLFMIFSFDDFDFVNTIEIR